MTFPHATGGALTPSALNGNDTVTRAWPPLVSARPALNSCLSQTKIVCVALGFFPLLGTNQAHTTSSGKRESGSGVVNFAVHQGRATSPRWIPRWRVSPTASTFSRALRARRANCSAEIT